MNKVTEEIAISEVNKWLEYKKITEKKKGGFKSQIEALCDSVEAGDLSVQEDFTLVQKLKFPIGSEATIGELKYKPRVTVGTFHLHMQGVKSDDIDGRICAYVAGLTGNTKEVIKKLDSEDYSLAQAIAIFFL